KWGSGGARIAISADISTTWRREIIFPVRPMPRAPGNMRMAKVRKLLANAPGRIRRRFAQFIAIAAASLPSAGA
ncbi:hypothetical protein ABTK14_23755, partial [Acinetobacter baumannii]